MAICTYNCFLDSCKKEYFMDSVYKDMFRYCNGQCYQKDFQNKVPKINQK